MSTTSAQPRGPWRVEPPERSPAAIRAELPEAMRAQFDADYLAALEEARTSYRLDRLNEVIQEWWLSGWARRSPRHGQAMETGRRFLAGEPVATFPVDLDALSQVASCGVTGDRRHGRSAQDAVSWPTSRVPVTVDGSGWSSAMTRASDVSDR